MTKLFICLLVTLLFLLKLTYSQQQLQIQIIEKKPDIKGCVNSEFKISLILLKSDDQQYSVYKLNSNGGSTVDQDISINRTIYYDLTYRNLLFGSNEINLELLPNVGNVIKFNLATINCEAIRLPTYGLPAPLLQNKNWLFDKVPYYIHFPMAQPGQLLTISTVSGPYSLSLSTTIIPGVYTLSRSINNPIGVVSDIIFEVSDTNGMKSTNSIQTEVKNSVMTNIGTASSYTNFAPTYAYGFVFEANIPDMFFDISDTDRTHQGSPNLVRYMNNKYIFAYSHIYSFADSSTYATLKTKTSLASLETIATAQTARWTPITITPIAKPDSSVMVFNTTAGYLMSNVKFEKTYVPYIPFSLSTQFVYPSAFPFGVVGSNQASQIMEFSLPFSAYYKGTEQTLKIVFDTTRLDKIIFPTNNFNQDNVPPMIEKLSVIDFDSQSYKIILHVVDYLSGFHSLSLASSPQFITYKHLVEGDLHNGIYERTLSKLKPFPLDFENANVIDFAGNTFTIKNGYINFYPVRTIDFNQNLINPFKLVRFTFNTSTELDISQNNIGVELSLKLPISDPKLPILFTLGPIYSSIEYSIDNLKPFYYDSAFGGYKITFTIPAGKFFSGYLPYTLYIQSIRYTHTEINSIFGPSTQLKITNNNPTIDLFPPMITNIQYSTQTVGLEVGFDIITDKQVSYYEIILTSAYNHVGLNFSGVPTSNIITTKFTPNCISGDSYTISSITLVRDGLKTSTKDPSLLHPMVSISGKAGIVVNCPIYYNPDPTPPELVSFEVSKTRVDLSSNDRVVEFKVTIKDDQTEISTSYTPTIYLISVGNTLTCKATYILSSDPVAFTCSIEIPATYPTNNPILLSIYGYTNKIFTYGGASTDDLQLAGFQSTIYLTGNPLIPTIRSSNIDSTGKELQLKGDNFGTYSDIIVQVDYGFGFKPITTFNRINNNEIQLHSLETTKTISVKVLVLNKESNTVTHTIPYCPGNCNNHGYCNLVCICTPPWAGLDCLSTAITIPEPSVNTTEPVFNGNYTVEEKEVLTTLIAISSLREIDYNTQQPLHSYSFKTWLFKNLTEETGVKQYLYSTNITKPNTSIITWVNVTTRWFDEASNITFAGQFLHMSPSTVKYYISISNYPFESSLNHMQLIMSATLDSSKSNNICSIKEFTNDTENAYIKLQLNQYTLSGRFIERGIIDGRVQRVTNTLLDSQMNTISSSGNIAQSYIGINIANYQQQVEIDPDFSVLIDQKSATSNDENSICNNKSKKPVLTTAQIVGIAVGGAVFLFIIIGAIVWVAAKKGHSKMAIKLRNMALKS